jgi:hypothetical protein
MSLFESVVHQLATKKPRSWQPPCFTEFMSTLRKTERTMIANISNGFVGDVIEHDRISNNVNSRDEKVQDS